jgi:surface antigen
MLATLTRDRYKSGSGDSGLVMVFDSKDFGQFMTRLMDSARVGHRISDTAARLKTEEVGLKEASQQLAAKQAESTALKARLEQQNGRLLAVVAERDHQLSLIDGQSKSLFSQIASVNRAIVAAQTPPKRPTPSGGFSSGGGSGGGGGSCGNHFDYGYCTWYVASRRCIPWFGNANEWYANARSYGYPEGKEARVGAVVVWGSGGGYGSVGHVAYVESVQPDGFTVSEYNYTNGWNHYDQRFVPYSNPGPLYGFIYGK